VIAISATTWGLLSKRSLMEKLPFVFRHSQQAEPTKHLLAISLMERQDPSSIRGRGEPYIGYVQPEGII